MFRKRLRNQRTNKTSAPERRGLREQVRAGRGHWKAAAGVTRSAWGGLPLTWPHTRTLSQLGLWGWGWGDKPCAPSWLVRREQKAAGLCACWED